MANKFDYSSPYPSSTSGIRGVSYVPDRDKWDAKISYNGKRVRLGHFNTKEEAQAAYAGAAAKILERREQDVAERRREQTQQKLQSLFD